MTCNCGIFFLYLKCELNIGFLVWIFGKKFVKIVSIGIGKEQKMSMKISLYIHEKYKEPEIVICGPEHNKQMKELFQLVSDSVNEMITVYEENNAAKIPCASIIRFYGEDQKVFAQTEKRRYGVRYRLYELEELLEQQKFVRISNSEIVNVRKIRRLDTSMAGTIHMYLQGGIETYVSRRYVSRIKQVLGMGKEKK